MANLSKIEMAAAISKDSRINIKKSFLGLSTTIVYVPTQSVVKYKNYDLDAAMSTLVERILNAPEDKLAETVKAQGKITPVAMANVKLELCVSDDQQFAAAQLFRYVDFKYVPMTDFKTYEGDNAKLIAGII
jgi:hypothetical protein